MPALDKQVRAGLGEPPAGLFAAWGEVVTQYLCPHGYVRGVCGVCTDPDHNCQAPRLKKQVARLKKQVETVQALVAEKDTALAAAEGAFQQLLSADIGYTRARTEKDMQRRRS